MKLISSKTKLLIDWVKWNLNSIEEVEGKKWERREGLKRMTELDLMEPMIIFGNSKAYRCTKLYNEISNNYYSLIHN